MKTKVILFIKEWLLHFAGFVLCFNFFDILDFLSESARWGGYDNGNTRLDSAADRLIRHNFAHLEILQFMGFTFLGELLYRFVFKKYRWPVFIITSALACCIVVALHVTYSGTHLTFIWQPFWVLMGYTTGYALLRDFFHRKLYRLNVRLGKKESELQMLKQQLDPHFLFNTLNYLYGTALREKAERTAEGIEVMSGMMRYSLTGMQETFVSLNNEVSFIEQYIYLQRVRLPAHIADGIKVSITTTASDVRIAPMLFIPFIENAFKHGVSTEDSIDISINIALKGKELTVLIINTYEGHLVQGTKNGLDLAKKRIDLLYPGNHKLQIIDINNRYNVLLVLTLQSVKNKSQF